jgi:non-specific protein-tyrosine kinase
MTEAHMNNGNGRPDVYDKLVTVSSPRSPVAEAYRTLRTNIQFSSLDAPLRTLLVTSSGPDEGKSTTLANLAVAMAQGEQQVILVDCDLRRPAQHIIFGLSNTAGLTNLFLEDAPPRELLQPTPQAGLRVLTSGPLPPNPAELVGSRKMERIVETLKGDADIVLFDTPPIIAVTDAAVLASKLDAVILVVRAGKAKRDLVRKARDLLQKVNARLLGVVLNDVRFDTDIFREYYADRRAP